MPPKRTQDGAQTGADKKRQRMRDSRTIPVAPSTGRTGGSAGSGNKGLPPTLEVEKFAQARSFEISAMQRAMKAAKEAGTQRAFQSLPRHLRRRAASHNIRRLPLRLRKRALAEVPKDAAKPKRVTRKMLGKHRLRKKPGLKAQMFLKRQQNKIWLETHVWHAKRMHMTEIWGHRLAEMPTAKAFRSSYRASQHGALVHDASYYQYFELRGPFEDLQKLLERVCDPVTVGPWSKRYSTGAREYTTDVYDSSATYPRGLLGPCTFIWQPASSSSPSSAEPAASTSTSPSSPTRTVLIRAHPSLAPLALASFRHALESLRLGLSTTLTPHTRQFLTFEITGSRATEVLKKVLRPVKGTDGATKKAWKAAGVAEGPAGVPQGMVFGMEVYDPRLSFPPQLDPSDAAPPPPTGPDDEPLLVPSAQIASVPKFWDEKAREKISEPRFRKADLDARRAENLIPGTRLTPLAQDDRIPILLSQRTLGSSSSPSSSASAGSSPIYGWTLTLPAGWGMPFLSSLVFSTPRVGGLRERAHQFFEASQARYPEDYVGTPGFEEHEVRRESDERGYWERRPPAKRPSYARLGTRWPWRAEMGEVVQLGWPAGGAAEKGKGKEKMVEEDEDMKDGAAEAGPEDEQAKNDADAPFLVPSSVVQAVLAGAASPSSASPAALPVDSTSPRARSAALTARLLSDWRTVASSSSSSAPPTLPAGALLPHALIRVRLDPLARGVPEDLALVYELDEETAQEVWEKVGRMSGKEKRREGRAVGEWEGAEDLCTPPKHEQLIGRVTSGGFALSEGHGAALGVVSLYRLLALSQRKPHLQRIVLFRNRDSETFRAAKLEVV
ncbi:hypothetical protein JCM8097_004489 [Rhodosporidiobolus ruineniae]